MSSQKGVTLIELMIALGILAIIAAIALPNFQTLMQNNRMTTTGNEVLGLTQLARAEAIRNNRPVILSLNAAPNLAADEGHITVFVDNNRNGVEDAGDRRIRTYVMSNTQISLEAKRSGAVVNTVTYLPNGRTTVNAETQVHICDERDQGHQVVIRNSGQSRLDAGAAIC